MSTGIGAKNPETFSNSFYNVPKVKLIKENAIVPTKANEHDVGHDLYSVEEGVIPSGGRACVQTGIVIVPPNGYYGRICPRSGLAVKYGIDVGAGIIDPGYRGEVGVVLFNHGDKDFEYKVGDKIAQLVFHQVNCNGFIQVEELDNTERGEKGFGSSG